jgi:hypothetical protein
MNYLEHRLALKNGTALPKVKPAKEIKKESSKMTVVKQELKKLYTIFLAKRKKCEIKSPECTKEATCVHHVSGRLKDNLMNQNSWKAACQRCNGWVEDNHAKAEAMGMKKSKFKKG